MEIVVIRQCDAIIGGQRKALFPGQRYDLAEDLARELVAAGLVQSSVRAAVVPVETGTRLVGRPRGGGR
jgi:hypothetical protein